MGILDKLFGTNKTQTKPYVEAGLVLTHKLVESLQLEGWQNRLPIYSPQEEEAINQELASFQKIANSVAGPGNEMVFHPDIVGEIQRAQVSHALEALGGIGWRYTDKSKLPDDWKGRIKCRVPYILI